MDQNSTIKSDTFLDRPESTFFHFFAYLELNKRYAGFSLLPYVFLYTNCLAYTIFIYKGIPYYRDSIVILSPFDYDMDPDLDLEIDQIWT
jgi:hypothetical protein